MLDVRESLLFKCRICGCVSTDFNMCECIDLVMKAWSDYYDECTCSLINNPYRDYDWIVTWMKSTIEPFTRLNLKAYWCLYYESWFYMHNDQPRAVLGTELIFSKIIKVNNIAILSALKHSYHNGFAVEFDLDSDLNVCDMRIDIPGLSKQMFLTAEQMVQVGFHAYAYKAMRDRNVGVKFSWNIRTYPKYPAHNVYCPNCTEKLRKELNI